MTLAVAAMALVLQFPPLPPILPPLPPIPPIPCIPLLDPDCESDPLPPPLPPPPPSDDPPKAVTAIHIDKAGGWIDLTWKPATDDVEIWGYRFYRDGSFVARRGDLATSIRLRLPCGRHRYRIEAVDSAEQLASRSFHARRVCPAK